MRRLLAPILALVLVVAACGGDGTDESTTSSTAASEVTTTTGGGPADPDRTPADGDTVGVFYTGTLDDGEQFDSNVGGQPLTFEVGAGRVISGFDQAVRGLKVGESVTVRIEPAEAYGEKDPALIIEIPRDGSEEGFQVGDTAFLGTGQQVTIVEIREDVIVVDANHRLAGEALTFTIELVSIN